MNNSLPQFVLRPWEFEGVPCSPLAHATVACDWEGERRKMRLKVRENLLFFAPEARNRRLYALSAPVAETAEKAEEWKTCPEELQKLFAKEYARGRWGRIVVLPEKTRCNLALVNGRGTGWVRALYSDHFERITPKNAVEGGHELVINFQEKPLKALLRSKWSKPLNATERPELSLSARKRAHINPLWVSGSLAELREALEAAIGVFPILERGPYAPSPRVLTRSALHPARLDWMGTQCSPQLEKIGNLLLKIHVCVGQSVEHTGYFFEPYFVVELKTDSMHERMEAMLSLRDLMRGTGIENEVIEILRASL